MRSSGNGGQNVNRVSPLVQLTWQVGASSPPAAIKERFQKLYASRIAADGRLKLEASPHRSQLLNRQAARARLARKILKASFVPNRPTTSKSKRGAVKPFRRGAGDDGRIAETGQPG